MPGLLTLDEAIADISPYRGSASQKPDPFAIGKALGILTDADRDVFDQFNGTYSGHDFLSNFAQSIAADPQLVALLVTWRVINYNDGYGGMPWHVVFDNVTHTAGFTPQYTSGMEVPAGLTSAQQSQYVSDITTIFPVVLEAFAQNDAGDAERAADVALAEARANAMAQGTTQTPYGPVATVLIAEGPVTLPDGMAYLVMNDVTGDPSKSYVLWWQTASFIPLTGDNHSHVPGECLYAAGTGEWYALGSIGATCPAPPSGWVNDGYRMVSPRARASLSLSSSYEAPQHVDDPSVQYTGTASPIVDNGPTHIVPPSNEVLLSTVPGATHPVTGVPMMAPSATGAALLLIGGAVALAVLASKSLRGR